MNSTFAQLSSSSTTSSPIIPQKSSSKAWIAGPVIGAVVLILVVLGCFFWHRRRRRQRNLAWLQQPSTLASSTGSYTGPQDARPQEKPADGVANLLPQQGMNLHELSATRQDNPSDWQHELAS